MFIDIPHYPFDGDKEEFGNTPPIMVGYNTKYMTEVAVVKTPEFENVWVLSFKILGEEEKNGLAFPNEEEPTRIKAAIEAAESSQYVKEFKEVL